MRKFQNLITLFLAFFILTSFGTAAAKSPVELSEVTVAEDTEEVLKIEIPFKGKLSEDDYVLRSTANFVLIEFDETLPGRIKRSDLAKIHTDNFLEKVNIYEIGKNKVRLRFTLSESVNEGDYSAQILPKSKAGKKSARLVLTIKKGKSSEESETYNINDKVVVIDAGHGGSDTGAVGPGGVTEKSVALAVALKTEKLLKNSGAKVIMTRTTDRDVAAPGVSAGTELQARVNKAPAQADIFISIHCNAFSNPAAHGMETYHHRGSNRGRYLATLLNEELEKYGGLFNRGVKGAGFYVLRHSACPASLIELGFITNYREEKLLSDENYQQKLARAITAAVSRYFGE